MESIEKKKLHPFHLVGPSPWPFVVSLGVLILAVGFVLWMHGLDHILLLAGVLFLGTALVFWWRDVLAESNTKGIYTSAVQAGLKIGMGLFIASEVMLFVSFFWGYFYNALDPKEAIGFVWPPKNIHPLDPFDLPYLNTLILLLSGTAVTWAHHSLAHHQKEAAAQGVAVTIGLGVLFSCIQGFEYAHASFGIKEGIYPSLFYMATGFHGFHVVVGTIFLTVGWWQLKWGKLTPDHHVGFEAASWYWHFVDVVWLFLFVSIYWWGYAP